MVIPTGRITVIPRTCKEPPVKKLIVAVMHRLIVFAEDDAAIVRRHDSCFDMPKTVIRGKRDNVVEISNTPIGIAHPQIHIEAMIAVRSVYAIFHERAIEVQHASRPQRTGSASHQPGARRPRRDMDHVDADDGVGIGNRPIPGRCIKACRVKKICQSGLGAMRRDAGNGLRIQIGRLPIQMGQGGGEKRGMLARAARNFQNQARSRENA
jgi:hypothetical protein